MILDPSVEADSRSVNQENTDRITGFLDFFHHKQKTRFGNWICFRPQVRGEDIYSVGPFWKHDGSLLCSHSQLDSVLSQMNPVHILTAYFLMTHFNAILPFTSTIVIII
jgi:hypothetical protein